MTQAEIKNLVSQMTLEEKATMCSGADFWHTEAIERLGIPASMVSDGPHGLRKQDDKADHLGVNESIKAVCFPAGCGTAASFNRDLIKEMGATLANECQAEGVSVILGPAMNIKRSPVCGRNFEYYSEDPLVAGEMAGALISGVQSGGVGTSAKHFLANNQEHRRMTCSSNIDERTLREIYLGAFESAVKSSHPWTIMASYNRINGVHATEQKEYLTDVLRGEWGFDGYVMSDWGAVNDRVAELAAGMDLEMPSSNGENDKLIVEAVKNGTLDEAVLDQAVERILNIVYRFEENRKPDAVWDLDADHEMARKIAQETMVLLKNDDILPLTADKKIAFIGQYASKPRYQGGGSSHINSRRITSAMDAVSEYCTVTYAQGYSDKADVIDETMMAEAVKVASEAEVAVLFVGLPDLIESEGFDRPDMKMPKNQNELIDRVCEVNKNVVIVLHNGAPVEMPWLPKVKGVLEAYLSGEACGGAVVDILFGKVSPSAKLPETFPVKYEDNPSYLSFPGEGNEVNYTEGVFVGYRYYDRKKMDVLFPFGFGLSYTEFEYSNLKLDKTSMKDTDEVTVTVDVKNVGKMAGKEVVQLYVNDVESKVIRPVNELRDFVKIELQPGETKTVTFVLGKRAFAYFNTTLHDWHVETGDFMIRIGKSSRDIVLEEKIYVESTVRVPVKYTLDSCVLDLQEDPVAYEIAKPYLKLGFFEAQNNEDNDDSATAEAMSKDMMEAMVRYMPLRGVLSFSNGETTMDDLKELVEKLNNL
ncbi:MAG: glycoside hydrolase family 3 C-terminal domain-containing protein [Saccharofermentans sp.]|nr:glycoside hydrolase family 3 C-terminal domain-containing protein [Saccharofermentans sp.]